MSRSPEPPSINPIDAAYIAGIVDGEGTYKKARAELILQHYLELTPSNGKYTAELLQKKIAFEDELLAIKANMHSVKAPDSDRS